MRDFSKAELAGSLAVPILTFVWGLICTIDRMRWGGGVLGNSGFNLIYPLTIIFGGALPIFLTLKYKIHTEDYLKKRIIFIIPVFIIYTLISGSFLKVMWRFFLYILLGTGIIIFEVFKIQDESTTGKERAVLMLSDPIIYWSLENLIMSFIDIIDLGPFLKYYGWY